MSPTKQIQLYKQLSKPDFNTEEISEWDVFGMFGWRNIHEQPGNSTPISHQKSPLSQNTRLCF